jgi:succinyl-diaminopimelate desuccinylase
MLQADLVEGVMKHIHEGELVDLARALVRINSVWDPESGTSEKEVAEFVAKWARDEGFQVTVEEVLPARPNVIITWEGVDPSRTLMFEAHTDVVTPGDPSLWRYDPFGGDVVDGKLFGRGANDTKGNLAAMLIAMASIKRSGVKVQGRIIAGVLCDEEGMMAGVQDFIRRGHADGVTAAIICEPQDGMICHVQKGAIRARFIAKGRMSHGAMPLSGLNPMPLLGKVIGGLSQMELKAIEKVGKDPLLGWPSFTPTVFRAPSRGPAQLNVIPATAELLVDIRTVPAQSHEEIVRELRELASRCLRETEEEYRSLDTLLGIERERALELRLEILTDRPCTHTPLDHPLVRALDWATKSVTGRDPVHGGVPGATDGTYLWALKGIPIVTTGAGKREVPHQVDEWVDLGQLLDTAKIYALGALAYFSIPS